MVGVTWIREWQCLSRLSIFQKLSSSWLENAQTPLYCWWRARCKSWYLKVIHWLVLQMLMEKLVLSWVLIIITWTDNQHAPPVKFPSIEGEYGSFSGVCCESNVLVLSRTLLWYIVGQKWWDLARDISIYNCHETPFPPKQCWILDKMGGNESLLATRLLGGGGEMGNEGMNPKPIIGSKVLCNNYVDGFFLAPPSSFDLHCLTLRIFLHFSYQIVNLNSKHNSGWPQRNRKQN